LDGRYAIRMCVMNHTTAPADVQRTLDWLAITPVPISGRASALRRWHSPPAQATARAPAAL
jgi:hypothetical protein